MPNLLAGTGKTLITPHNGVEMIGYFNRPDVSQGVHDDLYARALVLDDGNEQVALCSVELLWLRDQDVEAIRQSVTARCPLTAAQIFIFATHTHGGPAIHQPSNWDFPLYERIADAIVDAYNVRQPARLGCGFGMLYGYSINRRWMNRPVDPAVGVIRVDRADGSPLAVLGNFACHAVVMGYDNLLITGDWAGYGSRLLEDQLPGAVALFAQGGAGNVNPLTETVRQRLEAGHPITAIGWVSNYYGWRDDAPDAWNIEDRGGGQFIECETIARAYAAEVIRVWRAIVTEPSVPLWNERVVVEATVGSDEPPAAGVTPSATSVINSLAGGKITLDIRLVGIGSAVLVGQPGEVFSETSLAFRVVAQNLGYGFPLLVSYANGTYAYMPPEDAFPEGGYEVKWALGLGISRYTQNRIAAAIKPLLQKHVPK